MAEPGREPSPNVLRARRLLAGGAVGGHLSVVVCVIVFGWAGGAAGAVSAALAGILTIVFFTVGQAVQVLVADADPRRVLLAALVSYVARIGALGGLLAVALANRERLAGMDTTAVVVSTVAAVVGWLAGEILVFSRLRIPVFDETERPADTGMAKR
jgi:hypothetical protein